ncbi:MAG: hypothetical protein ACW9W4_01205 [Candidatus Nitrosopumilus sp. bin_7KS]
MGDKACIGCRIVYIMISDSCDTPMCKKCGGSVKNIGNLPYDDYYSDFKRDNCWSSNTASKLDIDADYEPKLL